MSIIDIVQSYFEKKDKNNSNRLFSNLTIEEQTKIFDELANDSSKKITINEYYSHFGIDIENSIINELLKPDKKDKTLEPTLIEYFPEFKLKTLESIFSHKIPNQLIEITQDRINKKNEKLLEGYIRRYNNPEPERKTLRNHARKIRHFVYDLGIFAVSFGSMSVVRPTYDEIYKEALIKFYQEKKQESQIQNLKLAEAIVLEYFKIENRFNQFDQMMKNNAQTFARKMCNYDDNNLIYDKPLINNSLKQNN